MSAILPLLVKKEPVPEQLLGYWFVALHDKIPVFTTQFVVETVLPTWRVIGKKVIRRSNIGVEIKQFPRFFKWFEKIPKDIEYAVAMLTSADDKRCVIFFDKFTRRAELINKLSNIVPEPLCDEILEALLWVCRLMMERLFVSWEATPKPILEPWKATASAMYYVYLRITCKKTRESAGEDLFKGGLVEFLKELDEIVNVVSSEEK